VTRSTRGRRAISSSTSPGPGCCGRCTRTTSGSSRSTGRNHDVKGEASTYVITEDGYEGDDDLRERITESVEDAIGPIARPEQIVFTDDLPKTRSGKIMRRLLEDIANGDDFGDTSTLRNPDIVEEIQGRVTCD